MAMDSTLFAAVVPAGTYAVGDRIPLAAIRGPKIVRDGYGAAYLKKIMCASDLTNQSGVFAIHVKNSNWIDEVSNIAVASDAETLLSDSSAAIQNGQNLPLVPNSGWEVYAECMNGATTTAATDLFCLIDVDYPKVAAVENPKIVQGFPVTIEPKGITTAINAMGTCDVAKWDSVSVDILKAGSKYLLVEAGFFDNGAIGFLSISGAAGQAGLERIIPVKTGTNRGAKYNIEYATPLVKGPMNLNILSFGTARTGVTPYIYLDFVKKSI